MRKNQLLFLVAVSMVPFVVISFLFNNSEETNFIFEQIPVEKKPIAEIQKDENITVKIKTNKEILTLDLEDYIIGVVAGEMPASFNEEALKAQAVASRSYALYRKSISNGEYDLTDNINTQVYINESSMRQKWANEYDKYYNRIKNCVEATKGEVLVYDGNIVEALYFSMSNGQTQNSQSVFGGYREYLQSVESIYDNESISHFDYTRNISISDFKKNLGITCDKIEIKNVKYNSSHYIESISICDKIFTGTQVRNRLALRSDDFIIEVGDTVKITTYGFGHGVGMSQYGAQGYAQNGYTYNEILEHYYNGAKIKNIKSV